MIKRSVSNLDMLKVIDEDSRITSYGCNQEWYTTEWQRCAGCGPSVVSTILIYQSRSAGESINPLNTKEKCLALMEEVWQTVTPTDHGIPTVQMLHDSLLCYARSKTWSIDCNACDVPDNAADRPTLTEVIDFISNGLANDLPIAFLNRCNGDEKNLDQWHWVVLIALEYTEADGSALITILDEGVLKRIDLALWVKTTTQGGGFVYFTMSPEENLKRVK